MKIKSFKSWFKTTWLQEMESQLLVFSELTGASHDVNICICERANNTPIISVLYPRTLNSLSITYLHIQTEKFSARGKSNTQL